MFDFIKHMLTAPEAKASRTARLIALESGGRARGTPRETAALAREGPAKNAVVHRAVRLVAEGVGSVSFLLHEDGREHDTHPLLDLIARPNPRQDGASLMEAVTTHLLLAGNAYLEAVTLESDTVREIYALRPDRMRVVPGADGWPEAFDYTVGGRSVRFDQSVRPVPPILHLTFFNPLDDHYGLPPLDAAAVAVDTHNAAAVWNKALLDNAARPSGALIYAGPDGAVLSDGQFERLKRELSDQYQGAGNAGRPLLLEGGLD
ncbi:MAG: phage portal protein, partial [Pseudolabrys sp.]